MGPYLAVGKGTDSGTLSRDHHAGDGEGIADGVNALNQGTPLGHLVGFWRWAWLAALALVIAFPPASTATWLRSGNDELTTQLVTGLWLGKVLLVVNLLLIPAIRRWFPEPPSTGTADPQYVRWLMVLLAVAAALRIPGLGTGLWLDEIQTQLDYARMPWGQLLTTFDTTNQHLLYSISARLAQSVGGESALTLRLPAMVFGVASIWASLFFGLRWMPRREAWWAAVLLVVSYHHVWFSQNARGYTALLVGTLVSSALFLDLVRGERSGPRWIWSYAFVTTLTLLTHVTALVVVATHGLVWLWRVRQLRAGPTRWAPLVAMVLAGTLTAAAYAPIFTQVLKAVGGSGGATVAYKWQDPAWFLTEFVRAAISGVPAGAIVVPAAALIGIIGLYAAWRQDRVATVLMVMPLALIAGLVLLAGHNFWPRFFFFGAAFLVQLAVRGGFGILELVLGRRQPTGGRRLGDVVLGGLTVASLFLLPRAWQPKQDYERAVTWVDANRAPGDVVLATDIAHFVIDRYLKREWILADTPEQLAAFESPRQTTWVLYTFPIRMASIDPALWDLLNRRYQVAHTIPGTVGGGEIVIMKYQPNSTHAPRQK